MPVIEYRGKRPVISDGAVVMEGTYIIGDVAIGEGTSVWFGAVLRADFAPIRIGRHSSVQDNVVVHAVSGRGVDIGDNVTIGHGTVLHACTIEDNALIGINATVLDAAVVGRGSIIAAGCVVTPGTVVKPWSLVAGVPGKVLRDLGEASEQDRQSHAELYWELAKSYLGS
jgi:carbonic anhydrase/acetyltransferase-like protein (isoleucine patch superfamily)